jgi:hypothetical protein
MPRTCRVIHRSVKLVHSRNDLGLDEETCAGIKILGLETLDLVVEVSGVAEHRAPENSHAYRFHGPASD